MSERVRAQSDAGAAVVQVAEQREDWRGEYRFDYKVILPVDGLKHGLFVEMRLTDDDSEFRCVTIVRAHTQRK